jgi:transcriptional regulator with XRE-family HTH domain
MLITKLSQEMKEKGISTRQVAQMAKVSHTTILRALRGKTVDVGTIVKISEWLRVKPSTLLNSMITTEEGLPDQIAVLLESSPQLAKELGKAIKAIKSGQVSHAIIDDIAAYTAYKINLMSVHS